MRSVRSHTFVAAILIAGLTSVSFGQFAEDALRFSQYNSPIGARALSLGGTSVGRAEDFTALFANPAGLAGIRDYEMSIGFARNGIQNDATFLGNVTGSSNNVTVLDNAGLVYPIPTTRGSLTFALGFGRVANFTSSASYAGFNASSSIVPSLLPGYVRTIRPPTGATDLYALTLEGERELLRTNIPYQLWLADTSDGYLFPILTDSLQQQGTVYEGGGMNHWSFGAAIDVARNLSLGFSMNFISGSYSYDREFVESDAANIYSSSYAPPYNFDRWSFVSTIESELSGFNMLVGLMMR